MRTCTRIALMAKPCAVCSKVLKEAYRVRDRFGKPTQLETVVVNLLDEALCENTPSTVCRKCRYDLLRLEKLKKEYEEVKSQLKTQLRANRASQQLQRRQVLRLRSPSAESTAVSPAAKRTDRSVSTARKELFLTENQRLSVSSRYAHEDISSLESCLNYLRLDCLRTSMSKRLETVINSDTIRVNCIHNRAMFPRPSSLHGCVAERV